MLDAGRLIIERKCCDIANGIDLLGHFHRLFYHQTTVAIQRFIYDLPHYRGYTGCQQDHRRFDTVAVLQPHRATAVFPFKSGRFTVDESDGFSLMVPAEEGALTQCRIVFQRVKGEEK